MQVPRAPTRTDPTRASAPTRARGAPLPHALTRARVAPCARQARKLSVDGVPVGAPIWPRIQSLTTGAPLAMLCTSPACLQRFFKTTTASRPPGAKGATVVIGASGDHSFLRDPVALRSFVHDARKYALAASM